MKEINEFNLVVETERDRTSAYSFIAYVYPQPSLELFSPPPQKSTSHKQKGPRVKRNSALYRFTSTSSAAFSFISYGLMEHCITVRNWKVFGDFIFGVF